MGRKKSKLIKFLEIDEVKKFEKPLLERAKKAIDNGCKTVEEKIAVRDFTLINLVYACALRISEACKLQMNYLDLDNKQLYVIDGKGGDRIVPIPDVVIKNLELWLKIRPQWKGNNYVFTNIKGTTRPGKIRGINQKYYNQLFDKLSEESGIKLRNGSNVHPHTLRHSRAMELNDNDTPLEVIQCILGHKEISTTQIYARVRNEKIKQAQNMVTAGINVL